MKLVAIESPFASRGPYTVWENVEFARMVCFWATQQGVSPYASHLLFPQFLEDRRPQERALGIQCGLAWTSKADEAWFCLRQGESLSPGMLEALDAHRYLGIPMYALTFGPGRGQGMELVSQVDISELERAAET